MDYKSDFAIIKRWVVARVEEMEQRQNKQSNKDKKSKITNYEQREYSKEFLDSLYENNNFTSENTEEDEMDFDM